MSHRDQLPEFVRAASPQLLHTAWLLTGDRHRSEDLVRTALIRTYAAWGRVPRDVVFGYYAGPAARITAVLNGTPVTARTARRSGSARVVVFWFSPGTGAPPPTPHTAVTGPRAYAAAGRPLPAGDTAVRDN